MPTDLNQLDAYMRGEPDQYQIRWTVFQCEMHYWHLAVQFGMSGRICISGLHLHEKANAEEFAHAWLVTYFAIQKAAPLPWRLIEPRVGRIVLPDPLIDERSQKPWTCLTNCGFALVERVLPDREEVQQAEAEATEPGPDPQKFDQASQYISACMVHALTAPMPAGLR